MIKECTCKHSQQDKLHGKQQRVKNALPHDPKKLQQYRCSVCGKESE